MIKKMRNTQLKTLVILFDFTFHIQHHQSFSLDQSSK